MFITCKPLIIVNTKMLSRVNCYYFLPSTTNDYLNERVSRSCYICKPPTMLITAVYFIAPFVFVLSVNTLMITVSLLLDYLPAHKHSIGMPLITSAQETKVTGRVRLEKPHSWLLKIFNFIVTLN